MYRNVTGTHQQEDPGSQRDRTEDSAESFVYGQVDIGSGRHGCFLGVLGVRYMRTTLCLKDDEDKPVMRIKVLLLAQANHAKLKNRACQKNSAARSI